MKVPDLLVGYFHCLTSRSTAREDEDRLRRSEDAMLGRSGSALARERSINDRAPQLHQTKTSDYDNRTFSFGSYGHRTAY